KDAQFGTMEFEYKKCRKIRSYVPEFPVDPFKVQEAAGLIDVAERPLILFGQGVIIGRAEEELKAFIEKTGIPAAWTLLGLSALPTDHPLNVGMLGMHGNYGPNLLTNEADLIISVGMRFDDRVTSKVSTYAQQAKIIHLEIDPAEINKIVKADVAVLGDSKKSLRMLTDNVIENRHDEWLKRFRECDKIENEKIIQKDLYPEKPGLTMGEAVRIASEKTGHDAILVTDVGQHQMIASRYFKFKRSRSFVTSGGLGTMGFGLPAGMGAQIGAPDRTVVTFIGDGGFQMTIQELGTIAQNKLPVKIIVLNNHFLGMVRQWQQMFFEKRYSFTELQNPDFVAIAKGYGIESHKVDVRSDLESGIQKMIDYDGPYVLEVVIEKEDNVFPMVPSGASVSDVMLEP
ncbi:MAG: thiamine pyrophosphate-binding protein, partial [Prolixibacteraceae bacterium]|nr:thiamine pyrophosphate-binding protein [Prolixibacteraceae bacterium]